MSKSVISKIVESILKKTKPSYMDSQEEIELFLKNKKDTGFKTIFHTEYLHNMKTVIFNYKNSKSCILYIHGGAYVNQLNIQHKFYCFIMSKVLKINVFAPAYPLAPEHDYMESFDLITRLYSDLISKYEHVILMGDSAGGGFILSFCHYLNEIKLKEPDNIIVFSPWVDISMENCIDNPYDPILGKIGLKEIGRKWAMNSDTKNYMVSPIYSDNYRLPRTLIFAGTNEIFYRDIDEYYRKLAENNVDVELIVGEDLFHIYPLFPIPEALNVIKKIRNEIDY